MSRPSLKAPREHQKVIFRDVLIFQVKLFLDGVKDIILSPVSIMAAIADVVSPTDRVGKRFYHVMLMGERIDRWLNLFGAAERADAGEDGLFGASRAGSNTLLGRLETIVTGRNEMGAASGVGGTGAPGASTRPDFDDHPLDWDRSDHQRRVDEFERDLRQGPPSASAPAVSASAPAEPLGAEPSTEPDDDDHATDPLQREELNHDLFGQPDP